MGMVLKIVFLITILIVGVVLGIYSNVPDKNTSTSQKYQGPVPEGYDEQYFRETGITQLIGGEE